MMVKITYSQPKLKPTWDKKIRRIWNLIRTTATPDLWIKVFVKRDFHKKMRNGEWYHSLTTGWSGHYRSVDGGHGFYDKEWAVIDKNPRIRHCITLKIGESCTDEGIAKLMAHEYRHYLQWKKYGPLRMNNKRNGVGRRPIQVERDANKWMKNRVDKIRDKLGGEE